MNRATSCIKQAHWYGLEIDVQADLYKAQCAGPAQPTFSTSPTQQSQLSTWLPLVPMAPQVSSSIGRGLRLTACVFGANSGQQFMHIHLRHMPTQTAALQHFCQV